MLFVFAYTGVRLYQDSGETLISCMACCFIAVMWRHSDPFKKVYIMDLTAPH